MESRRDCHPLGPARPRPVAFLCRQRRYRRVRGAPPTRIQALACVWGRQTQGGIVGGCSPHHWLAIARGATVVLPRNAFPHLLRRHPVCGASRLPWGVPVVLSGAAWMPLLRPSAEAARRTLNRASPLAGSACQGASWATWTSDRKNGTRCSQESRREDVGLARAPGLSRFPAPQRMFHARDHACMHEATQPVRLRRRLAASVSAPASARRTRGAPALAPRVVRDLRDVPFGSSTRLREGDHASRKNTFAGKGGLRNHRRTPWRRC